MGTKKAVDAPQTHNTRDNNKEHVCILEEIAQERPSNNGQQV